MRALVFASLLAASVPGVAQDIQINMNPFGGSVSVKPPPQAEPEPQPAAQRTEEVRGDGFHLVYKTSESGATMLEVVEPAGVQMAARKGNFTAHKDTVPTAFHADGGIWYQIILRAQNGSTLEHRVQAKAGMVGTLRFFPPQGGASAPPPPVANDRRPLSDQHFQQLALAIQNENFKDGKMNVLQSALPGVWFSVAQVGQLVELFDFSPEKVEVVRLTRNQIVDRENAFQLFQRFDFEADKAKVRALLAAN